MKYFGFDKCIKKYFSFSLFDDEDSDDILDTDSTLDNYINEVYVTSLSELYELMKLDEYNKLGVIVLQNVNNNEDYIIINFKNTILDNKQLENMVSSNNIVKKSYNSNKYKLLFFNLGNNMWFYFEWNPLYYRDSIWTSMYNIYNNKSILYQKNVTMNKTKGYKNTKHIIKHYKDDITKHSIFHYIKKSKYDLYIPSINELQYIYYIVSKYKLFNFLNIGERVCFSSTCSEKMTGYVNLQYNYVKSLSFVNGSVYDTQKHQVEFGSIALLHIV